MLQLSSAKLAEARLQGLWRALDEHRSGFITCGEFLRFVKRGVPKAPDSARGGGHGLQRGVQRKRAKDEEMQWLRNSTRNAKALTKQMEEETRRLEALLLERSRSLPKLDSRSSFVTQGEM